MFLVVKRVNWLVKLKLMRNIANKPYDFILAKRQGVNSIKMIQSILASSLVPATSTNALSCDCMDMASSDDVGMAFLSWPIFDGSHGHGYGYMIVMPFMQLFYFIQSLFMQLSYMTEYVDACFHGLIMLVGGLAVLSFCIGLFCRVVFGGEACESLIGRAFVLSGEVVMCLGSPLMYKWIDIRLQWLRNEHQRLLKLKDKVGIMFVQNRMISLYESKRALDGLVNGFWDEEHIRAETPDEKRIRYLDSELCEVSEPEYWQLLHHESSSTSSSESESSPEDPNGGLAPALRGYAEAREAALSRAYDGLHEAEARSDQRAIDQCNETINMLTMI